MTENETTQTKLIEEIPFEDFNASNFISLKIGEEAEMEVAKIQKVKGEDIRYNLSGVDYKYEIVGKDGRILSINSWNLKKALNNLKVKGGDKIKLRHEGKGKYFIERIGK